MPPRNFCLPRMTSYTSSLAARSASAFASAASSMGRFWRLMNTTPLSIRGTGDHRNAYFLETDSPETFSVAGKKFANSMDAACSKMAFAFKSVGMSGVP